MTSCPFCGSTDIELRSFRDGKGALRRDGKRATCTDCLAAGPLAKGSMAAMQAFDGNLTQMLLGKAQEERMMLYASLNALVDELQKEEDSLSTASQQALQIAEGTLQNLRARATGIL